MDEPILAFVDVGDEAITTIADSAGWCRLAALNRVTIMQSTQDAKLFSRIPATWNVALRSSRFPQLPAKQLCDQSARGAYNAVVIADGAHQTRCWREFSAMLRPSPSKRSRPVTKPSHSAKSHRRMLYAPVAVQQT
jgi:hypothetical protein